MPWSPAALAFDPTAGSPISRIVRLNGRRTSLRLEPYLWDSLADIAAREGLRRNALLSRLELLVRAQAGETANFASVVRTYVIHYYRAALDPSVPRTTLPSPESTPSESDEPRP